jgi:penicillin-binding protein 2
VEIKARLFRQYPFGDVGSHVIGYMGRINKDDQAALENEGVDANYRGTDNIGKSGVEGHLRARAARHHRLRAGRDRRRRAAASARCRPRRRRPATTWC